MFCARCGQQIPDATEICPLCGREATFRVEPPASAVATVAATGQIVWPSETETKFPPVRRPDLRGVGGWLLFFCISLTVLGPLLMFIRVWGGGFELESMLDIALTAFGMLVGSIVWYVHARAFVFLWVFFD